jgi:hypothetical protein
MGDEKGNNIFLDDDEPNWDQLKKHMEKYKVFDRVICQEELPLNRFDLMLSLSNELKDFGLSKDFNKVGWAVKYIGNTKLTDKDGKVTDMSGEMGYIVGESNSRVIIQTDHGFFGWVNPEDYEIINLVHNYSTKLN